VEVRDRSQAPPALPRLEPDPEAPGDLTTFGRGLSIVARASDAWGAEREPEGKLVWFVPATSLRDDEVDGVLLGWDDDEEEASTWGERMSVHLDRAPVRLMLNALTHGAELRRELRLLAVAHQDTYPVAGDLSEFFSGLGRDFRSQFDGPDLHRAMDSGQELVDLQVSAPVDSGPRFSRLIELLDLADAFCRNERLLTLARPRELVVFQEWMYGEFVRQTSGAAPTPWHDQGAGLSRAHP
jgi:hypothetical protein